MVCEFCGKPLDNDAVFCPNCGGMVTVEKPEAAPVNNQSGNKNDNKKMIIAIIAVVAVFVLLIGGIFGGVGIYKAHEKAHKDKYYNGSTMFFTDVNGNELADYYLEISDEVGENVYEGHHTEKDPYVLSLDQTGVYTFRVRDKSEDAKPYVMEFYIITTKEKDEKVKIDLAKQKNNNNNNNNDNNQQSDDTLSPKCQQNLDAVSEYMYYGYDYNLVSEYIVEDEDYIYYAKPNEHRAKYSIYQINKETDETIEIYTTQYRLGKLLINDNKLYIAMTSSDSLDSSIYMLDLNDVSAKPQLVIKEPGVKQYWDSFVSTNFKIEDRNILYFSSKSKDNIDYTDLFVSYSLEREAFKTKYMPYSGNEITIREAELFNSDGDEVYERNEKNLYENDDYIVLAADENNNIIENDQMMFHVSDRYVLVNKNTGQAKILINNDGDKYIEFLGIRSGKVYVDSCYMLPNSDSTVDDFKILDWNDLESVYL